MLKKVKITKLFGEKNVDINFKPNINILIGDNGCGKTTILELLNYSLKLDIFNLFKYDFEEIILEVDNFKFNILNFKNIIKISVFKEDKNLISNLEFRNTFFTHYDSDEKYFINFLKEEDLKSRKKRNYLSYNNENIQALHNFIEANNFKLNTSYIPLTRTYNFQEETFEKFTLNNVKKQINREYMKISEIYEKLNEDLKKKILIFPFKVNIQKKFNFLRTLNQVLEFNETDSLKINNAFTNMGVSLEEKNKYLKPYLDSVFKCKKIIKSEKYYDEKTNKILLPKNSKLESWIFKLIISHPEINIILDQTKLNYCLNIIELLNKNEEKKSEAKKNILSFEKIINNFFENNNKEISISSNGMIRILKKDNNFHLKDLSSLKFERKPNIIKLENLSSGEKQLITLFSNFIFRATNQNNIFIIDEPELSLHIKWQRKFCKSLSETNGNNQYILATHSPSIVSTCEDNCIEIGEH